MSQRTSSCMTQHHPPSPILFTYLPFTSYSVTASITSLPLSHVFLFPHMTFTSYMHTNTLSTLNWIVHCLPSALKPLMPSRMCSNPLSNIGHTCHIPVKIQLINNQMKHLNIRASAHYGNISDWNLPKIPPDCIVHTGKIEGNICPDLRNGKVYWRKIKVMCWMCAGSRISENPLASLS